MRTQSKNRSGYAAAMFRFAIALLLFIPCVAGQGSQEPLRKISDIMSLSREVAKQGVPVALVAQVYYCDDNWQFFFVGQGTDDFICVNNAREPFPLGSKIRLVGKTDIGAKNNVVVLRSASVLELGEPAQPLEVSFDETLLDRCDCRWVTGECVVETGYTDTRRTVLRCRENDYRFNVTFPAPMSAEGMLALIDARVRVTGNVAVDIDNGNVAGMELCCYESNIEVTQPTDLKIQATLPQRVADLWNDASAKEFHLVGQVTYVGRGGAFVESDSDGTWVHNKFDIPLKNGTIVDLYGSREQKKGASLNLRVVKEGGVADLSDPKPATPSELLLTRPESRRVRIQGRLERAEYAVNEAILSMVAMDGTRFIVNLPTSDGQFHSMNLSTAKDLTVAGTVSFSAKKPYEFEVYVPVPDDIMVLERTAMMDRGKVLGVFAVLAPLLVFVGVWGQMQRKQARARKKDLEKLAAELRLSFESIRDGVLILDPRQRIVHANQKVCDFAECEISPGELATRFLSRLETRMVNRDFVDDWHRLNDSDSSEELTLELEASNRIRSLEAFTAPVKNANGECLARLWAFHDVTEKQQLQSTLLHAQKQEAIGRLAGGFAHDFNNLLTGIIGSLSVAKLDDNKTVGEVREQLATAYGASERAANLVSQLLGFSRKTRLELQPNNVNQILVRMEALLRPALKSVEIVFDLDENTPMVRADDTRLEQVLLNICLNACDAIGEKGEIHIRSYSKIIENVDPCRFVVISIRDDGPGMSETTKEKIFEPFFTTKMGEGTGLGLAMAEGIVHQHGGWVECDSVAGIGTEFRIYLPAYIGRIVATRKTTSDSSHDLAGRSILVVDDEEVVRLATTEMLKQKGADVEFSTDGLQAIELLRRKNDFDVVLLDWTMPGLSGRETLQRLKAAHPDLPVIICSGFVFDVDDVERQASVCPDAVVQKPFDIEKLANPIAKVLEQSHGSQSAVDSSST